MVEGCSLREVKGKVDNEALELLLRRVNQRMHARQWLRTTGYVMIGGEAEGEAKGDVDSGALGLLGDIDGKIEMQG